MTRFPCVFACLFLFSSGAAGAQAASAAHDSSGSELQYVLYLSRHGVRSPTGKSAQYNAYSVAPWPEWPVQPG